MATASAPRQQLQPPTASAPPEKTPSRKKFVRLTLVAPGRRHLFYGVGRNLWHRGHRARRRLWARHPHSVADAPSLEPSHRVHDRRTLQRPALRGRLLRLGAPRHGELLGISGSLAVAGGHHFRYGDLSHAVCGLPDAAVSLVRGGASRSDGRAGGGDGLRAAEYCRGEAWFPPLRCGCSSRCRRRLR